MFSCSGIVLFKKAFSGPKSISTRVTGILKIWQNLRNIKSSKRAFSGPKSISTASYRHFKFWRVFLVFQHVSEVQGVAEEYDEVRVEHLPDVPAREQKPEEDVEREQSDPFAVLVGQALYEQGHEVLIIFFEVSEAVFVRQGLEAVFNPVDLDTQNHQIAKIQ